PVTSVLLKRGPPPSQPAAATTRLQIMIDQKRGEEERKVEDRVAEGLLGERIAVRAVDAQRIREKYAAEGKRRRKIQPTAQADDKRKQAHGEENQRVEE